MVVSHAKLSRQEGERHYQEERKGQMEDEVEDEVDEFSLIFLVSGSTCSLPRTRALRPRKLAATAPPFYLFIYSFISFASFFFNLHTIYACRVSPFSSETDSSALNLFDQTVFKIFIIS